MGVGCVVPAGDGGNGNNGAWAGALAATAVLVGDDLTGVGAIDDVAIPFVWGLAVINYFVGKGNANYPGPWSYTVPDKTSYYYNQPQPPNFNPGDFENIVKWAAGLTLGARAAQKWYEGTHPPPFYTAPQDATRIDRMPVIPLQPDLP